MYRKVTVSITKVLHGWSVQVDHNGKLRLLVSRTDSGKELTIVIEKLGASDHTQLNSSATFIKTRDSQGEIQRKPERHREYISLAAFKLEATSNSSLKAAELPDKVHSLCTEIFPCSK